MFAPHCEGMCFATFTLPTVESCISELSKFQPTQLFGTSLISVAWLILLAERTQAGEKSVGALQTARLVRGASILGMSGRGCGSVQSCTPCGRLGALQPLTWRWILRKLAREAAIRSSPQRAARRVCGVMADVFRAVDCGPVSLRSRHQCGRMARTSTLALQALVALVCLTVVSGQFFVNLNDKNKVPPACL